jgi:hypothetical protein
VREGRRLTVHLLPGDPHALLLEEEGLPASAPTHSIVSA